MEAIETSGRRVAVRLTPDARRQVRGGHPWVFDRSIESASHDAAAGTLAVVFDDKRRFMAVGLWDPHSPIRVRIVHAGEPVAIDATFWEQRLTDALRRRRTLVDDDATTAYRVVNGENDGFPGLVVDRYASTGVVKLYTAAWFPHLAEIVDLVVGRLGLDRVVVRLARNVAAGETHGLADGTTLVGTPPTEPVLFQERGLHFEADVVLGQKTGHFLDQRENRVLVGGLAAGLDVLDVFSCTGGFSVHAAAGGARSVTSVDVSQPALATARRNWARNTDHPGVAGATHTTIAGDAFDVLGRLADDGRRFGLVVIDPPSFASSASQVDRALRSYARLTALGLAVLDPGGVLVQSSCSSRIDQDALVRTVRGVADEAGVRLQEWARTGHAVDHPATFPEGHYLDTVVVRAR